MEGLSTGFDSMDSSTYPPRREQDSTFDPLAEFNRPSHSADFGIGARTLFAAALLLVGIGLCIWLVLLIHRAITSPDELGLMRRFAAVAPEQLATTLPSGPLHIPPAAMTTVGYMVLVFLLAIGAKVAVALVREGALLLRHTVPKDRDPAEGSPVP
jgi:hypothetical protein